jgi:hypothetical protein
MKGRHKRKPIFWRSVYDCLVKVFFFNVEVKIVKFINHFSVDINVSIHVCSYSARCVLSLSTIAAVGLSFKCSKL